jgi:hypothetical protein
LDGFKLARDFDERFSLTRVCLDLVDFVDAAEEARFWRDCERDRRLDVLFSGFSCLASTFLEAVGALAVFRFAGCSLSTP